MDQSYRPAGRVPGLSPRPHPAIAQWPTREQIDQVKKQLDEFKKQPVQVTLESDHPNNISTEDVEKKIEELQDKGILTKPLVKSDNIKLDQKEPKKEIKRESKIAKKRSQIADAPRPKKGDYFTDINVDDANHNSNGEKFLNRHGNSSDPALPRPEPF